MSTDMCASVCSANVFVFVGEQYTCSMHACMSLSMCGHTTSHVHASVCAWHVPMWSVSV